MFQVSAYLITSVCKKMVVFSVVYSKNGHLQVKSSHDHSQWMIILEVVVC